MKLVLAAAVALLPVAAMAATTPPLAPSGGSSATAAITGGTINGATIGATTPAAGVFTAMTASNSYLTNIYGPGGTSAAMVIATNGTIGVGHSITVSGGSLTIPAGAVSASSINQTGFTAPATATTACTVGQAGDITVSGTSYHYACVATNTWVRVAMASF